MPAIARYGDLVSSPDGAGRNCANPLITSVGEVNSNNVYSNGILIVVKGNQITPHNKVGCSIDTSTLSTHSNTVFIGGLGVGRIGDLYGNNTIISGSPNVFSG